MSDMRMNTMGGEKIKKVVKRDPQLALLWFQTIGYGCIFLVGSALAIAAYTLLLTGRDKESLSFGFSTNVTTSVMWGVLFLFSLLRLLYLLRVNYYRQAAASGDAALLARMQPKIERQKVASPLVIKYHAVGRSYAIFTGFIVLVVVLVAALYSIPFFVVGNELLGAFSGPFGMVVGLVILVIILLILGIALWSVRNQSNIDVVAFSNGLLKKTSMKEQFIQWQDVRLVAVDSRARIGGERKPIMLEVVSRDELLQIPWVYQKRTWRTLFLFLQPVLSFGAYEEQMQMLLRVIVGETRLPLYDLTKRAEK
jgi:hypothetical protein